VGEEEETVMRKATYLLAMAVAIAAPAMAQTSNSGAIGIGNPQASQAQVPQPSDGDVNWKGVGVGAGTVAGNILYVPAKVVYGILGGITGGASYLLTGGNAQTANTIWRSSLGGDYVLTPDMVTGQKPIHFSGPTMTAPESGAPTSPAVPAGSSAMNSTPARTASAANVGSSLNGSPIAGYSTTGGAVPQPADHGTGPVSPSGSAAKGTNGGVAVPPLPGTSIE
jgi:hypothetical protein